MTIASVDCSTQMKCCVIGKTVCRGRSRPLQCGKTFLTQTTFLNHDLCMLVFRASEACSHAISVFYAKQHEQLSVVGVILNLLGEQACWGSSEMLRVFVHLTAWRLVLSQDTSCRFQTLVPTHHRSVNRCCLIRVHLSIPASSTGVRFQSFQP
jgi:hypothetical protein